MIRKRPVRSPHCCGWSDGAVLCDWSTVYTARVGNKTPITITGWLKTCQYIEKMVAIVPFQFEPESDDETVAVADQQDQDISQGKASLFI